MKIPKLWLRIIYMRLRIFMSQLNKCPPWQPPLLYSKASPLPPTTITLQELEWIWIGIHRLSLRILHTLELPRLTTITMPLDSYPPVKLHIPIQALNPLGMCGHPTFTTCKSQAITTCLYSHQPIHLCRITNGLTNSRLLLLANFPGLLEAPG